MQPRQLVLIGQPQLSEEQADTLARKVLEITRGKRPTLVCATDEASMRIAELLAQPLGTTPQPNALWNSLFHQLDPQLCTERIVECLRLRCSNVEVVCLGPDVIKAVLDLLRTEKAPRNVVFTAIELQAELSGSSLEMYGGCKTPIFTDLQQLLSSVESPEPLDTTFENLSKLARRCLAQSFLSILSAYTDHDQGVASEYDFIPTLTAVERKRAAVEQLLPALEQKVDGTYSSQLAAVRQRLRDISQSRARQEQRMREIVETFSGLRSRVDKYLSTAEEIKMHGASLCTRLPKPPAVRILSLDRDDHNFLMVSVLLLKHTPRRYQIAYFPPSSTVGTFTLSPIGTSTRLPLASVFHFPPGEYQVFLHKEGNISQEKSNRFSFFIESAEGQTLMG